MGKKSYWYGGVFQNSDKEIYVVFAQKRKKVKKYEKKDKLILLEKGENLVEALKNLKKECKKKGLQLPQSCC